MKALNASSSFNLYQIIDPQSCYFKKQRHCIQFIRQGSAKKTPLAKFSACKQSIHVFQYLSMAKARPVQCCINIQTWCRAQMPTPDTED